MTVRIRGIYATALTALLDAVVLPSEPIAERFDDEFPATPPDVTVETTGDRQGVVLSGNADAVETVDSTLRSVGVDCLGWPAELNHGGIYAGEVTETRRGGVLVDCGPADGYLPDDRSTGDLTVGETVRVQVDHPSPPWQTDRPLLDTTLTIPGTLLSLVRGADSDRGRQPGIADIVPATPPDGWGVRWHAAEDEDVELAALGDALEQASERATDVDEALADARAPDDRDPGSYWTGEATRFIWFGRDTRFELDAIRRRVETTMAGHHRIKAGTETASAAVDFVEAVCSDPGPNEAVDGDGLPFEPLTRQFGPSIGETVRLDHGKPDGRRIVLGRAEVTDKDGDGTVTVRRSMTAGGTYDGLGIERKEGDVAVTKVREGRWWYPTVYRSSEGQRRGTYVNICTPVEVFPDAIRYVDLHVDVLKHADGTVERVDDEELDESVATGHVPADLAEKARAVASAVESAL